MKFIINFLVIIKNFEIYFIDIVSITNEKYSLEYVGKKNRKLVGSEKKAATINTCRGSINLYLFIYVYFLMHII